MADFTRERFFTIISEQFEREQTTRKFLNKFYMIRYFFLLDYHHQGGTFLINSFLKIFFSVNPTDNRFFISVTEQIDLFLKLCF